MFFFGSGQDCVCSVCPSFIDNFVRRTLQLEGFISLKLAIEKAKVIKIIQRENFSNFNNKYYKTSRNKNFESWERNDAREGGKDEEKEKEKEKVEKKRNATESSLPVAGSVRRTAK